MPSGVYIRTDKVKKQISEMMKKRFQNGWAHPLQGKTFSIESRKKMSKSHIGQIAWNKGIRHLAIVGDKNPAKRLEVRKKISESKKGIKNYNWKGGVIKLQNVIRDLFEYREWRTAVFMRDNYQCQTCWRVGGQLRADHIKAFSVIININNVKNLKDAINCIELWNLDNGRTLCQSCHEKTDSYLNCNVVKEYLRG